MRSFAGLLAYPGSAPEDDDSAAGVKPVRKSMAASRKSLARGEGLPESIAEEGGPGGGRKSLSLSSIRKSFMRRSAPRCAGTYVVWMMVDMIRGWGECLAKTYGKLGGRRASV